MKRRILLIEDNPISREFLYEALKSLELTIDVADTLATACILAQQYEHELFLCDVHLPDGGPSDILKSLRQLQNQAIAVAVTAEASLPIRQSLLDLGYQEVWAKPIAMTALQNNVMRIMCDHVAVDITAEAVKLWNEATALRAVGRNQATLLALRKMFLADLPHHAKFIEQSFANKDTAAIQAECHKLIASCGFVGADSLRDAVGQLSQHPGDEKNILALLQESKRYLNDN